MLRRSCSTLRWLSPSFLGFAGALAASGAPDAQVGTVRAEQKISSTEGGFGSLLQWYDAFGSSVASIGDLDGDGRAELAVGAFREGASDEGAVWILFLDPGGRVRAEQKIKNQRRGGFGGQLDRGDRFGISVASLGDLDRDGHPDLAVGAPGDDDGDPPEQGAVWILFLNADGSVKSEQKISETSGGLGAVLDFGDNFGHALAALGDLDGDGNPELAVGAWGDDPVGAVWVLFLNRDGTVKSERKMIDAPAGVGWSLARLGDVDRDGNADLAVGVPFDSDTDDPRDRIRRRDGQTFTRPGARPQGRGAVWILFLNADGTVRDQQKISGSAGRFGGELEDNDNFGYSLAPLGDLDGDGHPELAAGAWYDDDGGIDQGAVWLLFLDADGKVKSEQKISETSGGFEGSLDYQDNFGCSVASLGDIDGDGHVDLAVGAWN